MAESTRGKAMLKYELTFQSVDLSKPDLGPYTVPAPDLDRAVDLVIPMIKRDHPEIDLETEYKPLPIWRELPD